MATQADHIALANKNHDVLAHLLEDHERFPEWITTVAFYKAVQIVEAVFVSQTGRGCNDHGRRLRRLELPPYNTTRIFHHHRALWSASTVARYLCDQESHASYSTFTDFIPASEVVDKMIRKRLLKLEQIAIPFLGESVRSTLRQIDPNALP